jgi:hypothetical protein
MKSDPVRNPEGLTHGPTHGASGTELSVIRDIAARQQMGINKYGTTVADNPLCLREWLVHAYQEMLDGAIYLKRAIEMEEIKDAMEVEDPIPVIVS